MKLYFDGSCGPKNPGGHACYAFVVYDGEKELYRESGLEVSGPAATNNIAEYSGLVRGLRYVTNLEFKDLEIFGDSALVVNQLNGDWKCKKETLQPMLDEAKALLSNVPSWQATWISRELNQVADTLSKWQRVING